MLFCLFLLLKFNIIFALSNTTCKNQLKETIHPYIVAPLTVCHTIDRLFGLPHESVNVSLAGFLGRSYDPLIDKSFFPILQESFANCRRTPDYRFYIPDNYLAELIMDREIDSSVQLSTHFKDAVKDTSAGGSARGNSASGAGSGSANYQKTKKSMEKSENAMFHMTWKNKMFRLTGDLSAPFTKYYRNRLTPIIKAIENEYLMKARFLIQRLIVEMGTHITMQAMVGTLLEYRAYVANSAVTVDESVKSAVTVQAQQALENKDGSGGGSFSSNEKKKSKDTSFELNMETWTMGGTELRKLESTNPEDVIDDAYPVALSREIYPIYMMMESGNLNVSSNIERQLRDLFEEATNEYIERNVIAGCMDPTAANYDYQANVEDDTCVKKSCSILNPSRMCAFSSVSGQAENMNNRIKMVKLCMDKYSKVNKKFVSINGKFKVQKCDAYFENINTRPGGIYQTCEPNADSFRYDDELQKLEKQRTPPCDNFNVTNIVTGNLSCPLGLQDNVIISFEHVVPDVNVYHTQTHCFDLKKLNCTEVKTEIIIRDKVNLTSHWCGSMNARGSVGFRGYFDLGQVNNFIGKSGCPGGTMRVTLFHGTTLCLTKPHPLSAQLTLLYSNKDDTIVCPENQSKQLITVVNNEKIYGCIFKHDAYSNLNAPTIIKGPFLDKRVADDDYGRSHMIIQTGENDFKTIYLDDIGYNIFEFLENHMALLKQQNERVYKPHDSVSDYFAENYIPYIIGAVLLIVCLLAIIHACKK